MTTTTSTYRTEGVHRTARNGGVLVAVATNLNSSGAHELEIGGEQVWVKVEIKASTAHIFPIKKVFSSSEALPAGHHSAVMLTSG